jgi:hypothetical protein
VLEKLDEQDDFRIKKASFQLTPSIITKKVFDETVAFHSEIPSDLSPEEAACLLEPSGTAPAAGTASTVAVTTTSGTGLASTFGIKGADDLSLSDVATEILKEAEKLPAVSGDSAWDFSTLAATAASARVRLEEDVIVNKKIYESRLAAIHETDRDRISEHLSKADISHKQRVRKMQEHTKGKDFKEKMSARMSRGDSKRRMRNKAKHD